MPPRRLWHVQECDPRASKRLRDALHLHPMLAQILVARGIGEPEQAASFLSPRLADLNPAESMLGLEEAAERLAKAVTDRERILIYGDYDVDGITSVALLGVFLTACGADVSVTLACRDDGYGFTLKRAREVVQAKASVLVLVDCGTTDHPAVAAVTAEGVDVVAIDHHQVTRDAWPGLVLVNPHREGCQFPFKGMCSAGLAFYVVARLRRILEARGKKTPDPRDSLDLVALGTVADVAPLSDDNRILVSHGLRRLGTTRRPGLRELMRLANVTAQVPSSEDVGWRLGPRLNAPGRLGDARVSLDCLMLHDRQAGVQCARECVQLNDDRRRIQEDVEEAAQRQAQEQLAAGHAFLLLRGQDWHAGVLGIVASKIVSTAGRPTAVLSLLEDEAKGSARSVPGIDLVQLLKPCAKILHRFGGHAAAAGFSLPTNRVAELHERLTALTAPVLLAQQAPVLEVDVEAKLEQLDRELCYQLRRLMPHGCGNPEPVFAAYGLTVEESRVVGRDHLSLQLSENGRSMPAIAFSMGGREAELPPVVDVAFVPEINDYRGSNLRLRVVDIVAADGALAEKR